MMSEPTIPSVCFDEQLCFAAYTLTHAFTRRYRAALRGTGLTYPRFLAVSALALLDSPTTAELGHSLRMDYGTLSPMLKSLEREGIVSRNRSEIDERVVHVTLTESGRELATRADSLMAEVGASTGRTQLGMAAMVGEMVDIRDRLNHESAELERS